MFIVVNLNINSVDRTVYRYVHYVCVCVCVCVCSNANPLHYYVLRVPRKADRWR